MKYLLQKCFIELLIKTMTIFSVKDFESINAGSKLGGQINIFTFSKFRWQIRASKAAFNILIHALIIQQLKSYNLNESKMKSLLQKRLIKLLIKPITIFSVICFYFETTNGGSKLGEKTLVFIFSNLVTKCSFKGNVYHNN